MGVYQFIEDPEYYYDKATAKLRDGNYADGLDLLGESLRSMSFYPDYDGEFPLEAVALAIAETYMSMGQYPYALREFFRTLTVATEFEFETIMGLTECYRMLGNERAVQYYRTELDIEGFTPEKGVAPKSDGCIVLLDRPKKDDGDVVEFARKLMLSSGDKDYAKQMLLSVQEGSSDYIDANVYLSLLYLGDDDAKEALSCADKAIAAAGDNVPIHAVNARILALDKLGDTNTRDREAESYADYVSDEPEDYCRLAACMAQLGNDRLALGFIDKALPYTPYNRDLLLYKAQAKYNLGCLREAKSIMVTLQKLYPHDEVLRYYSREVEKAGGKLKMYPDIPPDEQMRMLGEIEEVFSAGSSAEDAAERLYRDERCFENINYFFGFGPDEVIVRLALVLSTSDLWTDYLLDKLIDPFFAPGPKRHLLCSLLLSRRVKRFDIVTGYILASRKLRMPARCADAGEAAENAYIRVFSSLVFTETPFEQKLMTAYRSMAAALVQTDFEDGMPDEYTLAAALATRCCACEIYGKPINSSGLFGAEQDEVAALLLRLEQTEKRMKEEKKAKKRGE